MKRRDEAAFQYDVCLSFAGNDRKYVKAVAKALVRFGARVFFDEYETVGLWGKNLFVHLDDIYQNAARFCVIFVSKSYADKLWTTHELQSAQARAFKTHGEYILPARFDKTSIPGLRDTIAYVDLRKITPPRFAGMILKKLGRREPSNYLPPVPDRLVKRVHPSTQKNKTIAISRSSHLFEALKRMTVDEREVVFNAFLNACPMGLPKEAHLNIDLLSRYTGFPISKIKRLCGAISSLGFETTIRQHDGCDGHLGDAKILALQWYDLSVGSAGGNATDLAIQMLDCATENFCPDCGMDALRRLDFSQLSSATKSSEALHPKAVK